MERFDTFSALISKINKNVRKLKSDATSKFSLRSSHVQYLYNLHRAGALSLKKLSQLCVADKAAVSRSIDELQALGYVKASDKKQYKLLYSKRNFFVFSYWNI